MQSLLIGSLNRGKQAEFSALLDGLDLQIVFPQTFFLELEIEESGADYAENAQIKAVTFAREGQMWTLADDSGLEVDVLGGEPGPYSHRVAGPGGDLTADILLDRLTTQPRPWTSLPLRRSSGEPDWRVFRRRHLSGESSRRNAATGASAMIQSSSSRVLGGPWLN
jgi:hypothetical protein